MNAEQVKETGVDVDDTMVDLVPAEATRPADAGAAIDRFQAFMPD